VKGVNAILGFEAKSTTNLNVVVVFLSNVIGFVNFTVLALTVAGYSSSPTKTLALLISFEDIAVSAVKVNFLTFIQATSLVFTLNETASISSAHLA
jgi:hypothetical protein